MLSATPVNNRFSDLRNQLALAYEGESETLREKLGVSKDIAINFSLASGLLLVTSASAAAVSGLALSLATRALANRRPAILPA